MKKLITMLALAMMGCATMVNAQVSNDNQDGVYKIEKHAQKYREGEIIVKFKSSSRAKAIAKNGVVSTGVSALDKALAAIGASEAEELMPLTGSQNVGRKVKAYNGSTVVTKNTSKIYRMSFDVQKIGGVQQAIEAVKAIDDVEYAEPNYIVYALDDDEPAATSCWNDVLCSLQWGLDALKLPAMSLLPKITTKRNVIAILDTGVDITHPDLVGNIWTNETEASGADDTDDDVNGYKDDIHGWDFINNTANIRDNNGHGTHCAGIAAATSNNETGVVGADPDAYIMPVTVMQSDGTGDIATIIKGIDYASANGADIISMSFGSYATSSAFEEALGKAYTTSVLVAAAGNDCLPINSSTRCPYCQMYGAPMFPAAYTFVLGVESSSDILGTRASYSNYDDDGHIYSAYGEEKLYNYELRAPGSNIMSTYLGGKYKALNGTSMACPFAAGAISRLLAVKEYASKEILFGDLIHASGNGILNILAAYQIEDADRKPSLELVTYTIDDNTSISDANDDDGRLDAGETVDIYPVIRNSWGQASNIKCSIATAENEDPTIITVINNDVDFGSELSSYAKATATNPLRIKVSDECADGRHICLVVGATCDNISSDLAQDVILTSENGVELGGMLTEDMTLYPNVHYIVTKNLAVPAGITLTIKPGTVIKFKDNTGISIANTMKSRNITEDGIYYQIHDVDLTKSGRVIAIGKPDSLIILTKADGCTGIFSVRYSEIPYVNVNNQQIYVSEYMDKDIWKYIMIKDCNTTNMGSYAFRYVSFENSIIKDCTAPFTNLLDCCFEKSNIYNIDTYYMLSSRSFINCNMTNITQTYRSIDGGYDFIDYKNCNLYPIYHSRTDELISLVDGSSTPVTYTTDVPCYYGSAKESIVRQSVYDIENGHSYGYFDLSNMLTEPSSEAHGIVWKVLVDGIDPQDEADQMSPLGVGKHKFEVYFNRAMNTAVAPNISMGVRSPYTQVPVAENGAWSDDGKIYTAYVTITGKTNSDGMNRIYVYGAQDDEYFEIPEEKIRFNVNVQAAGSMATGLMATEGLGKVTLNWETTETNFDDLLGFNVYRGTSADDCSTMVNTELIQPGDVEDGKMEQSFIDYDVTPGTTYYYIVKEMSTDLSQNAVSNAVACTPKTAEKGDANGSMAVDVADVVTEINYLTGLNPQPFIFEAADVNSDNSVNILDVVGTVNIITTPAGVKAMSADNTATYTVEDGVLYVESPVALGGVQVIVNAEKGTDFTAMDALSGLEQTGAWMSDSKYLFLAYSMSGKSIPSGKQALLRLGDAEASDMVLSDTNGRNIVAINGSATAIESLPFGIEESSNATVKYYDMMGRSVSKSAAQQKGFYIESIMVDGKCVKSYKILNK